MLANCSLFISSFHCYTPPFGAPVRSGYFAHTETISKNLNLLKLEDIYKLKVFYFNLIKDHIPSKFDAFCLNHSINSNCYKIRDPIYTIYRFKHELAWKSFHYYLINIINNTPSIGYRIRHIHTHFSVLLIKTYIIQTFSDVYFIHTCYVCLSAE